LEIVVPDAEEQQFDSEDSPTICPEVPSLP
jgi:hypothetical protein